MAFVKIGSVSALPDGETMEAKVEGHPYAVCNAGGAIRCLDGECPCTGGPLSQGAIRHGLLVCPWHNWRFDYKTGICAYDNSIRVSMFPVKIEGGDIYVDVSRPLAAPPLE
jgi:nitrite reductase (NADH) small subunit